MSINISKNYLKILASLQVKKYRQKYQLFLVEGEKIVNELIRDKPEIIDSILICDANPDQWQGSWQLFTMSRADMNRISSFSASSAVIAVCHLKFWQANRESERGLHLLLDQISDPGNLGTIIRTSEWFGVNRIWLTEGCVDPLNPKTIQSSMGSLFRIPVDYILTNQLDELPRPLMGAVLDGENFKNSRLDSNGTLVLGSESHGISNEIEQILDIRIKISDRPGNKAESLNVSVATGILMEALMSSK